MPSSADKKLEKKKSRKRDFFQNYILSDEVTRHSKTPVLNKGTKLHLHEDTTRARVHLLRSLAVEFVGTLFLTFVVAILGADSNASDYGPLAAGATLMLMVYAGGYISGAHYNPAVTLGIFIRGKVGASTAVAYVFVQIVGALVGAGIADGMTQDKGTEIGYPAKATNLNKGEAFALELFFTYLLVSTVLHTATTKVYADNSFYGLAIGSAVTLGGWYIGGMTGAALNPAVAIATMAIRDEMENVWIYILGPCAGGAIAAFVFAVTAECDEFEELQRSCVFPEFRSYVKKIPIQFKNLLVELIGTYVFTYSVAALPIAASQAETFGPAVTYMILIYAGGHVSGGHFNPALTLAVLLRGNHAISFAVAAAYMFVQFLGAWAGAGTAWALCDDVNLEIGYPMSNTSMKKTTAFVSEVMMTFMLSFVVLNVATTHSQKHNSHFGIAIGATIFLGNGIFENMAGYGGGMQNPALGTALTSVAGDFWDGGYMWVYWVGDIIGAVLAALFFRLTAPLTELKNEAKVSSPESKEENDDTDNGPNPTATPSGVHPL